MTAGSYTIALTADEQALLDKITFEVRMSTPYEERLENFDRVGELTERLLKRDAIPQHRLDWFTEAEYNIGGRGSSREQIFRRNAPPDTEIFRHPHFLKHPRYFVSGPDLPAQFVSAFQAEVANCGTVTSSDILPLARLKPDWMSGRRERFAIRFEQCADHRTVGGYRASSFRRRETRRRDRLAESGSTFASSPG
jgi:hypothetical protein